VAESGRWVAKLGRWVAKLGRWVAKSGRWVVKLGRWVANLVARLLATAALIFFLIFFGQKIKQKIFFKRKLGGNLLYTITTYKASSVISLTWYCYVGWYTDRTSRAFNKTKWV
jgi:hypothetical protein